MVRWRRDATNQVNHHLIYTQPAQSHADQQHYCPSGTRNSCFKYLHYHYIQRKHHHLRLLQYQQRIQLTVVAHQRKPPYNNNQNEWNQLISKTFTIHLFICLFAFTLYSTQCQYKCKQTHTHTQDILHCSKVHLHFQFSQLAPSHILRMYTLSVQRKSCWLCTFFISFCKSTNNHV